jgi:hypothetical protein
MLPIDIPHIGEKKYPKIEYDENSFSGYFNMPFLYSAKNVINFGSSLFGNIISPKSSFKKDYNKKVKRLVIY